MQGKVQREVEGMYREGTKESEGEGVGEGAGESLVKRTREGSGEWMTGESSVGEGRGNVSVIICYSMNHSKDEF